jgi:hypothetical protein
MINNAHIRLFWRENGKAHSKTITYLQMEKTSEIPELSRKIQGALR